MDREIEITMEKLRDVTVFRVHGDVTSVSRPFLQEAYESVEGQEATKILLKFDDNVYINSEGIMALSDILIEAKKRSQRVAIAGLSSHNNKILHMVGIDRLAGVYDTMDEALTGLNARS